MTIDYHTRNTTAFLHFILNIACSSISISDVNTSLLLDYVDPIYYSEKESKYTAPMIWIGLYVALASLWCIYQMGADLVHGIRNNKLWFPCKHFTINALSLTIIAVAMKLPVDLTAPMPGVFDQAAKLVSMAFMCTMMVNLLPSLASMGSNELLGNVAGLGVLVITLVVNICIQINTGVIVKFGKEIYKPLEPLLPRGNTCQEVQRVANDTLQLLSSTEDKVPKKLRSYSLSFSNGMKKMPYTANTEVAAAYVGILLLLLMIFISSSLATLRCKEIIQRKYQKQHAIASKDVQHSTTSNFLTVEELQKHVSNYWIMARSGSPQFMLICSATTTTSLLTCSLIIAYLLFVICRNSSNITEGNYESDYNWSTLVIFIVQSVGVILGSVAPVFRCVASARFNVDIKEKFMSPYHVGKHWTQKLHDWKYGYISLPFRSHKLKVVIKCLKNLFLDLCIVFQHIVVMVCNSCQLFLRVFRSEITRTEESSGQRNFVLQLGNEDHELADITLVTLSKSLDRLIQKSEKKQPENLMKLITEKSTHGFQGVRHHVQGTFPYCSSLPVVTLTTIAVTLPNIGKAKGDSLLESVREGLEYITLVEETFDANNESINAAKLLWEEVEFHHKWLGIKLKDIASQVNTEVDTTRQIVQHFLEKANSKISEESGSLDDESKFTSICASSMSRITQTIINVQRSPNELFDKLSSRIADIMAACLTNLPQVIAMKCHTNVIEKREATVEAAAKLLGETKQIINSLQSGPLKEKWDVYSAVTADDMLPYNNIWRSYQNQQY